MHPKYQGVIKLRKRGKSYREIARIVCVSKSSVSQWCKNLKLPIYAQKILEKKNNYPKELFRKYNQLKARKVQLENQKIKKEATSEIHPLSKYELLLVGATLYWGEGYKSERSRSKGVQLSNSDPYLVALFLRFLREIIGISEERLKVSIRIHPNINSKDAIKFWSKVTKIPQECFRITHQISRASKGKRPYNSLPYGTLDLRVNSRRMFYQIKGWIEGLIKQSVLN